MKIIARHKWVPRCTITESEDESRSGKFAYRRFTATISGWRNFKIYEGFLREGTADVIKGCVENIRARIDMGDETVFHEKGFFIKDKAEVSE